MDLVKRNTKIYYITQFLHSLVFTAPIWIVFYALRGVSVAEISIIVTAAYAMQMIWELPSGALADLMGRRNILVVGLLIGGISYLLYTQAYGFIPFLLLNFGISICDSFKSGSEEAMMFDTYKQEGKEGEISKMFANVSALYQVGLIIGAVAGGIIYTFNPVLPAVLYGMSLLLAAIISLWFIEPYIDSEKFTLKNYIFQMVQGSKEAFSSGKRATLLSLFYIFVGGIAWSSTLYFNENMLVDLGYSDQMRGFIGGGLRLINIILIMTVLRNNNFFNDRMRVLLFPIIMIIGYLPGLLLDGWIAPLFIQLAMLVTTARFVLLTPMVNKVFSSKYRATAISFLSLMIGFVYIALTGISTYIIPAYGMKFMYTTLGVVSIFIVVPLAYAIVKDMRLKNDTSVI